MLDIYREVYIKNAEGGKCGSDKGVRLVMRLANGENYCRIHTARAVSYELWLKSEKHVESTSNNSMTYGEHRQQL